MWYVHRVHADDFRHALEACRKLSGMVLPDGEDFLVVTRSPRWGSVFVQAYERHLRRS